MNSSPSDRWLEPLCPTPPPPDQQRRAFEHIVNDACSPVERIPPRPRLLRRALALHLRSLHHPVISSRQGPWQPTHRDYRSLLHQISPLLAHPIWINNQILAAPWTLYLPRISAYGHVDAVIQHPDQTIGIVILQAAPRIEERVRAAQAELGAAIASIADHHGPHITHAVTLWPSSPDAQAEYHHPDRCLGLWCDACDLSRYAARTVNAVRFIPHSAQPHAPADPTSR